MSLFLLPDHLLYPKQSNGYEHYSRENRRYTPNEEAMRLGQHLEIEIKKIREITTQLKRQSSLQYECYLTTADILSKYKTVLCIKLNKARSSLQMHISFILPAGSYFRIQNNNKYVHISKDIKNRLERSKARCINICFNMVNGKIIAHFPIHYFFNQYLENHGSRQDSRLFRLYHEQIQQILPLLEILLHESNNQTHFGLVQNSQRKKIWENNYRYSEMINITSHFNETYIETESQTREKERMKTMDIRNLLKYRRNTEDWLPKNNRIFEDPLFLKVLIPKNEIDFYPSLDELKYIRSMISMPIQQRSKNIYENNMILNHIHVRNIDHVHFQKINEGGFSEIFLSEIEYVYVFSTEGHEPLFDETKNKNEALHKYVVVKKEAKNMEKGRTIHQIQILKQIKNGTTIFLPKYYVVTNKNCFFSDSVVMDFLPFRDLKDFLNSNSKSVSLITKLHLILSITQSLRYIRDYQIAHLDLKPNNIMIFCNLLIKLIDFGESYHPGVCTEKHRPGYTIPYSSPEVYNQSQEHYSAKSDIFSLGVIIFEILYRRQPFRNSQTRDGDEIMRDYLDNWFIVPEEIETNGDRHILRLLNCIISRCLSPRSSDRPQLDWITLLIRQCFELLN